MNQIRTQPRAILFDLDQTLIRHTRSVGGLVKEALGILSPGRPGAESQFEVALAITGAQVWSRIGEYGGRGEQAITEMFAAALTSAGYEPQLAPPLFQHLLAGIGASAELSANAHATLDGLAARGLSIGIVTNGFTVLQTRKAREHGLLGRVQFILTSEDACVHKPDRRIFQLALDKLGTSPVDTWYVGDSHEKDIKGANDSGIVSVLFDPDRNFKSNRSGEPSMTPRYVIHDLIEVLRLYCLSAVEG